MIIIIIKQAGPAEWPNLESLRKVGRMGHPVTGDRLIAQLVWSLGYRQSIKIPKFLIVNNYSRSNNVSFCMGTLSGKLPK